MADSNNSGQFGNRNDTQQQAQKSAGKFGAEHGTDPSVAGKKGAEAQSTEAKAEGGRHSHQNDSTNS